MAGKLGMGLLETLLENLDRDLNLVNTTLTNPTITTSAAATFTGGVSLSSDLTNHGQVVNQMSLFGLNPIWAFNFGDPSVAASATRAGAKATLLTPVGTLFNLSLALAKTASQTAETTVAESTELMGATATASTSVALAAGATNVPIGDDLEIRRLTGNVGSHLDYTVGSTDLQINETTLVIFKGGNVITASQRLSWIFNAADELNLEGTEIVVSGAGTNVMGRVTGPTDDHNQLIFTASAADTTILEGSYLYLVAEHNTDILSIKGCIRTSGGTIAVTYGNV